MRITAITTFLLAAAPVAFAGQTAAPVPLQQSMVSHVDATACPLDMHVRQGGGGGLVATDKDKHPVDSQAVGARLRLLLNDRTESKSNRHLVKARVKVRGLGDSAKLVPLGRTADGGPDMAMTVTIPLIAGRDPDFAGDLVLPGFTAALIVELKSVTLDSGEVWSFKDQACRVVPDPLMLLHQ